MVVVLDTNVVLQARASGHRYHDIMKRWFAGDFTLAVSNEILSEYEEVITQRSGAARWRSFERLLSALPNVQYVAPTYRFGLIIADPDDNKFADCAVVAEADYVVTEDRHFDAMIGRGYKPQPISPNDFIREVLGLS